MELTRITLFTTAILVGSSLALTPHGGHHDHSDVNFANYHVIQVTPDNKDSLEILKKMDDTAEMVTNGAIEFWRSPTSVNETSILSVHPDIVGGLKAFFESRHIDFDVMVSDLQGLIDEEKEEIISKDEEGDGLNYRDPSVSYYSTENYNRLNQINMHLQEISREYPDKMSVESIGTTHEQRTIYMAVLKTENAIDRPAIFIECGIHAREWISPAFCMYTIKKLLSSDEHRMLDKFDFYIVPVTNPDGYDFTWTNNRMWRKNRSPGNTATNQGAYPLEVSVETKQFWGQIQGGFGQGGQQYPGFGQGSIWTEVGQQQPQRPQRPGSGSSKCVGTDPNRNFDIGFGGKGTSPRQCSDTFHGPTAFSEAESRAIRDTVRRIQSRQTIASYLSVHAFSQLWMLPFGYKKTRANDYTQLMDVARLATEALRSQYGTYYKYGPINKVIYQAAGSSVDWAYEVAGIKYAYALELRDTGNYGFLLPVSQIQPTNEETFAGLAAMVDKIKKEF